MKRPALLITIYYILGLAIGAYINRWYLVMIAMGIMVLLSLYLHKIYNMRALMLLPLVCLLAYVNLHGHMRVYDYPADESFEHRVEGQMDGSIEDMQLEDGEGYLILQVDTLEIKGVTYREPVKIKIYGKGFKGLGIGDAIQVRGKLNKLYPPMNPGGFHEKRYYGTKGFHYTAYAGSYNHIASRDNLLEHYIHKIKNGFYLIRQKGLRVIDKILPSDQSRLIKAMILGDKSGLNRMIKERYAKAGISHILAISGLHVAIIGYGLFLILCSVMNKKKALWVTVVFLGVYCLLTGGSVSTIRASLMLTVGLMAFFFGRSYDIYSSLAVVGLFLLVLNPLYLWDVGFLLSFSSVIGIVTLVPILDRWFNPRQYKIVSLIHVSVGATIGTLPVILYNYYEFQTYGILANLLVVPLMTIVVAMSFIALLVGSLSLPIGGFVIGIVYYILLFYDYLTQLIQKLPFHTITIGRPSLLYMVLLLVLIILLGIPYSEYVVFHQWKKWMIGYMVVVVVVSIYVMITPRYLMMTHLAIGQGDSTVIRTPSNHVFVVDGGGNRMKRQDEPDTGYYILRPYLKYNGIHKIDGLFMTHSDRDHVGGLIELMDYFPVERLYIPYGYKEKKEEDGLLTALLQKARDKKVAISYIQAGDTIEVGQVTLRTLYPYPGISYQGNNAYSTVLKVQYGEYENLLTGDIEAEEEKLLYDKLADELHSDIIKVPHHGSKSSSTKGLIGYVSPKIAVVSSGRDNAYGHPHQEVLERYQDNGVTLYNTAEDGAVIIKTDGESMGVLAYYTKREAYYSH